MVKRRKCGYEPEMNFSLFAVNHRKDSMKKDVSERDTGFVVGKLNQWSILVFVAIGTLQSFLNRFKTLKP